MMTENDNISMKTNQINWKISNNETIFTLRMQIYAYTDIRILISLRIIVCQYQLYHGITIMKKRSILQ